MSKWNEKLSVATCAALGMLAVSWVHAAMVDPTTIREDDVGPMTAYGETPAEAAAKKIVFEWNYMSMVERQPRKAFETYVSPDFCDHGHLVTGGRKACASAQEILPHWLQMFSAPLKPGERIEVPRMAAVDAEMVTMYGEGVDIFRVHDGRITDHWDASPPATVTLKAHKPSFLKWMLGPRNGPPPNEGPSISAVTVDAKLLNTVDVGPLTPYAETPQEKASKRILFEFNHMTMIEGRPKEAFEKYVSPDYCNHGHISTLMKRDCVGYAESLASAIRRDKPARLGQKIEIPTLASVDGEMVTMYGAGVDIFRVHDGKITDHWDASPPADTTIHAHPQSVVQHMIKVVAGEAPVGSPPPRR